MPTTLESIRGELRNLVGTFPMYTGDNEISDAQIDQAIKQAARRLSRDAPKIVVEDEVGDGGKYYDINILSKWKDDFSIILSIDYNAGNRVNADEAQNYLSEDDGDWMYYRDATKTWLYFPNHAPTANQTFRIAYTTTYTITSSESDIPFHLELALLYAAMSELAVIIQAHVEKGLDPPAGIEFVTNRNRGQGWKEIAEIYHKKYIKELGGQEVPAASVMRDEDLVMLGGGDYFFHPKRLR